MKAHVMRVNKAWLPSRNPDHQDKIQIEFVAETEEEKELTHQLANNTTFSGVEELGKEYGERRASISFTVPELPTYPR